MRIKAAAAEKAVGTGTIRSELLCARGFCFQPRDHGAQNCSDAKAC